MTTLTVADLDTHEGAGADENTVAPQTGRIIQLATAPGVRSPGMGATRAWAGGELVDIYDFGGLDLAGVSGIVITGMCDQVYLNRQREKLEKFVRGGGRLLINGHVSIPFLPGLPKWRKLAYSRPEDLVIESAAPHPLWHGIDPADLLFRTGSTGPHTREMLREIGVAGFYGRGYSVRLPEGSTVINTIGSLSAPIDYAFPLGDGEVVVHAGLDLAAFPRSQGSEGDPGTSLGNFESNARAWLGGTR